MPRLARLVRAGEVPPHRPREGSDNSVDIHKSPRRRTAVRGRGSGGRGTREKEGKGRFPLTVIVLDELNKYAPAKGGARSPTRSSTSRSGALPRRPLIGAQQSASRIDPDVFGRRASRFRAARRGGSRARRIRLDAALDQSSGALAEAGDDGAVAAVIPAPTVLEFPYPPWATRPEEVAGGSDPFEGL